MARQIPNFFWQLMKGVNQRVAARFWGKKRGGDLILVLTTRGRRTGQPHVTPLQYEEIEGVIHVASARGEQADWFRNILADPKVVVKVKGQEYTATAEPITDPVHIADFLEARLERRPRMISAMLLAEGLPPNFDRADLERFSAGKAMVALHLEEPSP